MTTEKPIAESTTPILVMDQGSSTCKFGFADADTPQVFPTCYGNHNEQLLPECDTYSKIYYCHDTKIHSASIALKYPIDRSVVTDWNSLKDIWSHMYTSLNIDSTQFPILIAESYLNPKVNRGKITEIMFESMDVPALQIAIRSVLSLLSTGKTSGMIVNSGHGFTDITPFYDGYAFPFAMKRFSVAGQDITDSLKLRLCQRGLYFETAHEIEVVNLIKEQHCYVFLGNDCMKTDEEIKYELPDGKIINLGNKRFISPEALFDPLIIGKDMAGIHNVIYDLTRKCSIEIRKLLLENIFLTGGTSTLPNLPKRLESEIKSLIPRDYKNVSVKTFLADKHSAWVGGSMLAKFSNFTDKCISREQYNECGSDFVYDYFF